MSLLSKATQINNFSLRTIVCASLLCYYLLELVIILLVKRPSRLLHFGFWESQIQLLCGVCGGHLKRKK
jgi:hypothetical protein